MTATAPPRASTRRWWFFDPLVGPSTGLVAAGGSLALGLAAALPAHLSEAGPVVCPSRLVTGLPCPGCGMVRGCTYLMHGDVATAWRFNPFAWVAVTVVVACVATVLWRVARREPMLPLTRAFPSRAAIAVVAAWLGWGLLRIVLILAGAWPNIA